MALLNVNREVQDTFYRYKMPSIIAKVEGKGNGVKTVIVNMVDIAKAIGRPATYTCKFFGCELGAQTQFDIKNDRYIVNGSHEASRLQDLLDIFIKKFVLCQECDNPETNMVVRRDAIGLVCIACGYQSIVDLRHKLCTYIVRNPPQKDKKVKKAEKPTKNGKGHSSEEETNNNEDESKKEKIKVHPEANGFAEDDWSVDISQEAVAARMKEISSGAAVLTVSDDLEKTPTERANLLHSFIKERVDDGTIKSSKAASDIANEAERLEMRSKAPLILVELLCDEQMRQQVKTYRNVFLRLCVENKKAQKSLLGGFEKMVELHQSKLLPKVAHIVKDFYDLDIIDEEVLIEWGGHPSKKYVPKDLSRQIHDKAAPVIKWLQEADEESSEEEEDEDEIEIEYTSRAATNGLKAEAKPQKVESGSGDAQEADDDEDDFDIDDI